LVSYHPNYFLDLFGDNFLQYIFPIDFYFTGLTFEKSLRYQFFV